MDQPVFRFVGRLSGASQLIGRSAQVIPSAGIPQSPSAGIVLANAHDELAARIALLALASDVTVRVDRQVLVQMGPEVDGVGLARHRFQRPHLFLLERRTVGVDLESEGLGRQITEFVIDEADGPTAPGRHATVQVAVGMAVQSVEPVESVHLALQCLKPNRQKQSL